MIAGRFHYLVARSRSTLPAINQIQRTSTHSNSVLRVEAYSIPRVRFVSASPTGAEGKKLTFALARDGNKRILLFRAIEFHIFREATTREHASRSFRRNYSSRRLGAREAPIAAVGLCLPRVPRLISHPTRIAFIIAISRNFFRADNRSAG